MSDLFTTCYYDAKRYYRVWDNYGNSVHYEDVTDLAHDFTPWAALYEHEWHAEVDDIHFAILGAGFVEPIADEEVITYLKSLT